MSAAQPKARIRPIRRPSFGQESNDEAWEKLRSAILQIYHKKASSLSFEELYRNAYNMVIHKHGADLYNGVRDTVKAYLSNDILREKILPTFNASHEHFLSVFNRCWCDHRVAMMMIRDILIYADRVYVKMSRLPSFYDMGVDLFREVVLHSSDYKVLERLQQALLELIENERNGLFIDRDIMKQNLELLDMLGALPDHKQSIYVTDFEDPFIQKTKEYYSAECKKLMGTMDLATYLENVETRLRGEIERLEHYILSSSASRLQQTVMEALLFRNLDQILQNLERNFDYLLDNERVADLKRLYKLVGKDGELDVVKELLKEHLKQLGLAINAKIDGNQRIANVSETVSSRPNSALTLISQESKSWVSEIILLKKKYDTLHELCFQADKSFQIVMNDAFEIIVGQKRKVPELLSIYLDEVLRKGSKMPDNEIELKIVEVMSLFLFVSEKDVFERHYKYLLAKRLLQKRSSSEDLERVVISKLKSQCGNQFTSKLEGMFNDIRLSADAASDFKSYIRNKQLTLSIDLSVTILTQTYWPISSPTELYNLTDELSQPMQVFNAFYENRHTGRKLTWLFHMGSADLKASFPSKKFELNVAPFQAMVLLLFNKADSLSFIEIRSSVNLSTDDVCRTLQSLTFGKFKILEKEPASRDVTSKDIFTLNMQFSSPLYRLKLPIVAVGRDVRDAYDDSKTIREKAEEERKHILDAAIVRIMKSRRTLDHNSLVVELTKHVQSRFIADIEMIKKRLDALIDREYIERSQDRLVNLFVHLSFSSRRYYNYVA